MSILTNKNIGRVELTTHNKVLCKICGGETYYDATKRCDGCWEMEKGLRMLADKDKDKAMRWLEERLKELKGK